MITILIAGNNIHDNERIASSVIGGTELTTCVICTRSASEALKIAESGTHKIDLFIISIKMKEQSGHRLADQLRKIPEYRDCPILFVTNLSYNLSGFPDLATFHSYRKHNYISLPVNRIDVQGKVGLYLEAIQSAQSGRSLEERAICLCHEKGEVLIHVKDILYAEVKNKLCSIYTAEECYEISRKNLTEIMEILDNRYFLRCHRGFALNVKQLKGIEKVDRRLWKAIFHISCGTCLISKTYIEAVMDQYKSINKGDFL
jgi:DNA-binding LytR/AlgR family response regulator